MGVPAKLILTKDEIGLELKTPTQDTFHTKLEDIKKIRIWKKSIWINGRRFAASVKNPLSWVAHIQGALLEKDLVPDPTEFQIIHKSDVRASIVFMESKVGH